jgi:hypothetical protein
MSRPFPLSLILFVVTGVVYVLQTIPYTGIFLMFVMAPFWSVALVNVGFIGVAIEAAVGRVSRWWLIVPMVFYSAYGAFAARDQLTHMMPLMRKRPPASMQNSTRSLWKATIQARAMGLG